MDIKEFLERNAWLVEEFTREHLPRDGVPRVLWDSVIYGATGGKKIRASFLFATVRAYGIPEEKVLPLAAGIEMIHSFSLVHDDLPCMDNDDFRRGKPSLHKAFGEAMGVLAGDALLVEGFRMFLGNREFFRAFGARKITAVMRILLEALGNQGMVGGQVLDLLYQGKEVTEQEVLEVYHRKTARFIQAPILCGGILGGASQKEKNLLANFGLLLGECFQIKDDILDVTQESARLGKTAGKDLVQGKATLVRIRGVQGAEEVMYDKFEKACQILASLPRDFTLLLALSRFVVTRDH
ncbi:MAG: polyprenyl synthetase family protein [Candidatus Caldatribacterium sp.]|uniref:polyprenyl synthetase family protein n=1 Tax=Candidatus Caldatribacterium sp. TaxID=2282143 RepID=UPI0029943FC1|nr:polyprenyl synthetase family protein [Candidatus Caldatribacterium sp.]MCX7730783.1 polyprenyl synthetase family protein [Candidatus Caldatribacterium sp.]MDW8080780.1 polyprenyl synthetase family protein [Candidatus Calescibacterium sp.]